MTNSPIRYWRWTDPYTRVPFASTKQEGNKLAQLHGLTYCPHCIGYAEPGSDGTCPRCAIVTHIVPIYYQSGACANEGEWCLFQIVSGPHVGDRGTLGELQDRFTLTTCHYRDYAIYETGIIVHPA